MTLRILSIDAHPADTFDQSDGTMGNVIASTLHLIPKEWQSNNSAIFREALERLLLLAR